MHHACSFTGHRPAKLGYRAGDGRGARLEALLFGEILALARRGVTRFYTGMAQGVDQWAARLVLEAKSGGLPLELVAVLPCPNQAAGWRGQERDCYFGLLARCDEVITCSPFYTPQCMLARNRFLVEHAGTLLAVYNGAPRSGTAYTVRCARRAGRELILIHPDTLEISRTLAQEPCQ